MSKTGFWLLLAMSAGAAGLASRMITLKADQGTEMQPEEPPPGGGGGGDWPAEKGEDGELAPNVIRGTLTARSPDGQSQSAEVRIWDINANALSQGDAVYVNLSGSETGHPCTTAALSCCVVQIAGQPNAKPGTPIGNSPAVLLDPGRSNRAKLDPGGGRLVWTSGDGASSELTLFDVAPLPVECKEEMQCFVEGFPLSGTASCEAAPGYGQSTFCERNVKQGWVRCRAWDLTGKHPRLVIDDIAWCDTPERCKGVDRPCYPPPK